VVVRAAIAVNWYAMPRGMPGYLSCVINDPNARMHERATAQVVKAVLDVAGVNLDGEGRLV